jgi:hypothetical protein
MPSMTDQARLTGALVLSVLLHGLLLTLLPLWRHAQLQIPVPALVDVDLVNLPKPAAPAHPPRAASAPAQAAPAPPPPAIPLPKQIVAMPEQGEEKEPENARFLSDRDNTVKEETVRHGEPLAGNPDAKPAAPPEQKAKAEPRAEAKPEAKAEAKAKPRPMPPAPHPATEHKTQLAALPKLDQLLPQPGDFARGGGGTLSEPEPRAPPPVQEAAAPRGQDLLRFGDPWRTGGTRGATMDALPSIREGDITLLNTKAEKFAPFVRRVAVRVFQNFLIMVGRTSGEGGAPEEYAAVEAVMDHEGNLLKLVPQDRSISAALATDRSLQEAIREGFFDRNPPPGAEGADGYIHFAFQARVVLMLEPSGRRVPGYVFMATGLM